MPPSRIRRAVLNASTARFIGTRGDGKTAMMRRRQLAQKLISKSRRRPHELLPSRCEDWRPVFRPHARRQGGWRCAAITFSPSRQCVESSSILSASAWRRQLQCGTVVLITSVFLRRREFYRPRRMETRSTSRAAPAAERPFMSAAECMGIPTAAHPTFAGYWRFRARSSLCSNRAWSDGYDRDSSRVRDSTANLAAVNQD